MREFNSVQFSHSVMSDSATPWTAAHQASLSITSSRSLPKLMSIESVMPSNHLILCHPLLLPSIFASIRVFSNEELFLHWEAYWVPTVLGNSSFSVLYFCLFILIMGFSRQEYWSGLPFPSPVDHILSDLSTMTHRLGWPHTAWLSFRELDKAVVHVIRLTSFLQLWFQSVCPLMPSLSNAGDLGSNPRLGRFPREWNGYPSMDRRT